MDFRSAYGATVPAIKRDSTMIPNPLRRIDFRTETSLWSSERAKGSLRLPICFEAHWIDVRSKSKRKAARFGAI